MVTNYLSFLNHKVVINGEVVEGVVSLSFASITDAEETYAQDGDMAIMGTGRRGGEMTITVLPTSRTGAKWLAEKARSQRGARIRYEGYSGDPELGYGSKLEDGFLKTYPPAIVPGENNEFVFVFKRIIPQMDATRFEASLD